MNGRGTYSEFYKETYRFPQEHRAMPGMTLFRAPEREAGTFREPPVTGVSLQVATKPRRGTAMLDLGAGRFRCDLARPCFVVAPAGQGGTYEIPTSIELLVVEFAPDSFETLGYRSDDLGRLHARAWNDALPVQMAEFLWTRSAGEIGALEADSLRLALASALVGLSGESGAARVHRGGLAPHRLRRVIEYLEANLNQDLSLATLAAEAGLPPHHFCRAFRESVGLPPHRYLVERRVERAKGLIAAGTPLVETALECGFANQQHLTVAFRKTTGMPPGRWRDDSKV